MREREREGDNTTCATTDESANLQWVIFRSRSGAAATAIGREFVCSAHRFKIISPLRRGLVAPKFTITQLPNKPSTIKKMFLLKKKCKTRSF